MSARSRGTIRLVLACSAAVAVASVPAASSDKDTPLLSLKASTPLTLAPARAVLTAEVRRGASDDEAFYCATREWDWGDGTISIVEPECEPYKAGKSAITRRHAAEHAFERGGVYEVVFRLKKGDRVVASARTCVRVRRGAHDYFVYYRPAPPNCSLGLPDLVEGWRIAEGSGFANSPRIR